jgi:hypothetical protein
MKDESSAGERSTTADRVIAALRDPVSTLSSSPREWDALIRQARRADLLPRLAHALAREGIAEKAPQAVQAHLTAATVLARAQRDEVRREAAHIVEALAPIGVEPVFLKGAAYVVAGLSAAHGRLFSDVDILVPHERLAQVEANLMSQGWVTTHPDAYDQQYYRRWMHELPPMEHIHRNTVLDVHHALSPRTARLQPDTRMLLDASVEVDFEGLRVKVLGPCDRVLHSMTHLFQNEETHHGLRDLWDMDAMLREGDVAFWEALPARAAKLGLERPLFWGLRYTRHMLGTPMPDSAVRACERNAPSSMVRATMDALWMRALRTPPAADARGWTYSAVQTAILVRAHAQRMPIRLLLRHAALKGWRAMRPAADTTR